MPDQLLPGRIHRQSEFVHGLTGDCGPDALDEAEAWADQRDCSADTVYATYQRMRAWGGCGPNGEATTAALAAQARRDGFTVEELPFQQPLPEATWRAFFDRHAGQRAIVFETARGAALRDWKTGNGENAGPDLRYHSVMIAGRHINEGPHDPQPSGWWCADGDNYDLGDTLQFYPDVVVAASQPVAAFAVAGRAVAARGETPPPDYPAAAWIPTTHHWAGRGGHTPRWIIIHGTASGAEQTAEHVARFFQANDPPTSTHYVVGRDGQIAQCVRESDTAWGNGVLSAGHDAWWQDGTNPNWLTFSIEHVKPHADNSDELTPEQQAASFALVKHLCDRWGIPTRQADASGGITGHRSIDPVNRAHCPGPYPWDRLWAYLQGASTMAFVKQPDGSARDDQTGVVLHYGMAAYVLAHDVAQHALLAETYYTADDSFVPCDGGLILTYHRQENTVRTDHGGEALLAIWNQLAAANARATTAASQVHDLAAQVAALQAQLAHAQPADASASAAIRALATALAAAAAT